MPFTYPPAAGFTLAESPSLAPWLRAPVRLPGTSSPFTVDLLVRLDAPLTRYSGLVSSLSPETTTDGFFLYFRNIDNGNIGFNIDGAYLAAGSVPIGPWFQVTATYQGGSAGNYRLYLDGEEIAAGTRSGVILRQDIVLTAFYTVNEGYHPQGTTLANLRLWGHEKTAEAIAALHGSDHDPDDPDLLLAVAFQDQGPFEQAETGQWVERRGDVPPDGIFRDTTIAATGEVTRVAPNLDGSTFAERVRDLTAAGAAEATPVYPGQIRGVVTVKGDPAAQRVLAFVRATGKKAAETTSAADGTYTLTGLNPAAAHYVVALDKNLEYNGVIADNIVPEVPA